MAYTVRVDIHTQQDPHHLFNTTTRILGARPGGADAHEHPAGSGTHTITTQRHQALNGALTLHYRLNGPHTHPGTTPAGHQIWLTTHMSLHPDTPVSQPALAANYLLRLGAWLDDHDHLWSWHHPHTGTRYSGARRFAAVADLFAPDRAPNPHQIHTQLLDSAHHANQRDGI